MPTLQKSYSSQGEKEIGKAYFSFTFMRVFPFIYDDIDVLLANTYVVVDDNDNCVVIDPSKDYDGIVNFINKNNYHPQGILLTHGHFDHFKGAKKLVDTFSIPVFIGFEEEEFLHNSSLNCSIMMGENLTFDIKPETIHDQQVLKLLNEDIRCIHTPMHTIGSYCYYLSKSEVLFTGDFLFKGSVGRWDLPTGSIKTLSSSMDKIKSLPLVTKIYPGHGPFSTLKLEIETNQYLK